MRFAVSSAGHLAGVPAPLFVVFLLLIELNEMSHEPVIYALSMIIDELDELLPI